MKNLVRMIAVLFAVTAVAVFAANVEATDNTVAWHGKTEPGKVVWRHVKNGGERFKYALPVEKYTHVFETDTINIMCMPPGDGQYLEKSHNRCDGWFLVSPEQAGDVGRRGGVRRLYCHRFRRKVARQELQGRCCTEKLMGGHGGSAQIHARFWRYRRDVWQQGKDENPLRRFYFR